MTKLYQNSKRILRPVDRWWHRFEVNGLEYIPEEGPLLVAIGGHACNIDPLHLGLQYTRELHYMAKKELFDIPILANIIKGYNAFPVKRGKSDTKAIRNVLDLLEKDQAVLMFVEGTRTKDGELGRVRKGLSFMAGMAVRKGIPVKISPTLLQGTYHMYRLWEFGYLPLCRKLSMKVGETIDPSEYDSVDELTDAISRSILELK